MDLQLKGKKALVTGSTQGIGFATAKLLLQEGAEVYINGRKQTGTDEAIARLKEEVPGAKVNGAAADLSEPGEVENLFKQVPELDILINNAGIFGPKPFEEITDEDWYRFFNINVMSGIRLSRFYFPKMLKKDWGRIIFISSESAINIPEDMIHYGFTKTALLSVSRGLAKLTKGTNVTVNSVLPGPTQSEGVEEMTGLDKGASKEKVEKDFFTHARPTSLLQRFTTPDEVAHMIVYTASPLSSATNGAALRVDGGVVNSIL